MIDYLFLFNVFSFVLAMRYVFTDYSDKYFKWLKQHPIWTCVILLFVALLSYKPDI